MMNDPKLTTFLSLLILQLFMGSAHAFETWSFPIENEMKTLQISNPKSQAQLFWLKGPPGSEETSFEVPGFSRLEIPLLMFQGQPWMKLQGDQKAALQVQIETLSKSKARMNSGSSTRWTVQTRTKNSLVLFNQAPFDQKIEIKSLGISESVELAAYEKKRIEIPRSGNLQTLKVSGEARFSGLLWTSAGPRPLTPDLTRAILATSPASRYFRLTNRSESQSYIVALKDNALIEKALKQISDPQSFQPRILVAQIDLGHGNFNRDFSSRSKAPWSWHVAEVFRFAELASQDCDGSPEFVEENLSGFIQGPSIICFWNYRIVEELSPEQVAQGRY